MQRLDILSRNQEEFVVMEPSLENIGDYNGLKGEKKRVVWAVLISGIILGAAVGVVSYFYGTPSDSIKTEKVGKIPLR
ncbi:hypothetical protein MNB_SM-7-501 [hydrothermal vent metagenome]|uniref:Uncharacterized protein n=1 Tax=hydrothermal vent metagenome TaxID=652676 RepID=A0A1W1BUY3_9ZZZZ